MYLRGLLDEDGLAVQLHELVVLLCYIQRLSGRAWA
jgi:hypothetical protein